MPGPKVVYYCRELEGVACSGCRKCEDRCKGELKAPLHTGRERCRRAAGHDGPCRFLRYVAGEEE